MSAFHPILEWSAHAGPVYSADHLRGTDRLFTASADRFVACWDLATGQQASFTVRLEVPAWSVLANAAPGMLFIGGGNGAIHVVDTHSRAELKNWQIHRAGVHALLPDPFQHFVYSAGADGLLVIWSFDGMEYIRSIPLCEAKIRQLSLSPDGRFLAAACGDGMVRVLDTAFFNEVISLRADPQGVTAVAWHPSKPVLITGGRDAHLRFWHVPEAAEIMAIPAHQFAIYSIVFSPDHSLCLTGSRDKTIKAWDPSSFDPVFRIDAHSGGHRHSVNQVQWIDDTRFLSVGDDRRVIVWAQPSGDQSSPATI